MVGTTGVQTLTNKTLASPTITGAIEPGLVVSGSSSSAALRITQTGTGNALVVEDAANPDSTPFVIDAVGNVISGYTQSLSTRISASTITPATQVVGASNNAVSFGIFGATANPTQYFAKSNGTLETPSAVVNGNIIGRFSFAGLDGSEYTEAVRITAEVDGTPGTNDMPGRLVFSTTADGAAAPTERMRIDSAGNVGIGITPTQKLHVYGNILATGSVDCGTQFLGLATDSATAPSFSFTGDENTGIFRPAADQVALTTNGVERLSVTTSQITGALPWRGQNGTAAAPAISASADTNTGIFFPAADSIAFAEGGAEVMRIDASGNVGIGVTSPSYKLDVTGDINVTGDFRKNGTVFAGLTGGQTGSAPLYAARAWVNFNGTGTVAIRASGNVSSITDNGVGRYFVNFTNLMPDANYSTVSTCNGDAYVQHVQASQTTALAYVAVNGTNNAAVDSTGVCVAIFR